jgi:hypothetical protein
MAAPVTRAKSEESFEIAVSNTGLNLKPLPPKNVSVSDFALSEAPS